MTLTVVVPLPDFSFVLREALTANSPPPDVIWEVFRKNEARKGKSAW